MPLQKAKHQIEKVNLITAVLALVAIILGSIIFFFSSNKILWLNNEHWKILLSNIGSLIFLSGLIAIMWEVWIKRAFLDEILAKAQISKEISFSGIIKITDVFHHDIEWNSYFRTVSKLDIFFAYGRTWRNTHKEELRKFVAREDTRLRVVLPDPEDDLTIMELARRFNYTKENVIDLIKEAENDFLSLKMNTGGGSSK